ncbi:hypothetical protein [Chryseobacterium indologenes]|uniref:hypothetical protein n=1 Tax=Chryseobacterium indologenes TaxID=253 RepID=UPI0016262150|nr:hypothetical protein [Chryseobacterium indologenes]
MDLEKIIREVRYNNIDSLLDDKFALVDNSEILIYAEYSISPDTNYIFLREKPGQRKIVTIKNISYERLCSIKDLVTLIGFYLSEYKKKTDDILVIDIIDHLTN